MKIKENLLQLREFIVNKQNIVLSAATILKYLFAMVLTFMIMDRSGEVFYGVVGAAELLLIFFVSNMFSEKKRVGFVINGLLFLFYNIQMLVFIFGNSFVTILMLSNLDSLKALSGSAGLYISGVVLILLFSFLPTVYCGKCKKKFNIIAVVCILILEMIIFQHAGNRYSPYYSYVNLAFQQYEKVMTSRRIASQVNAYSENPELMKNDNYHEAIADYRAKDVSLNVNPNIIVIFTEGLSSNIVEDTRGITPNIAHWKEKSIQFTNYYNHTFATYRGLNGQLYSGHQLTDIENNPLISMHSILADRGYHTTFINTEPHNEDFTWYLEHMDFHELISDSSMNCDGIADSLSDKTAYDLLYETAVQKASEKKPFFLSIYTFGTHASFDGVHEKFGEGENPLLNRFADMDAQFGAFMDKVTKNPKLDNTIIVFTTDHATYQDDPYSSSFPEYKRDFHSLDEIPFFIYHKGVTPEIVDVNGRNTIDFAPTLLDYLDITAPNYFLGTSLFAEKESSILETSYYDSVMIYSTKNDKISELKARDADVLNKQIDSYNILKALKMKSME